MLVATLAGLGSDELALHVVVLVLSSTTIFTTFSFILGHSVFAVSCSRRSTIIS